MRNLIFLFVLFLLLPALAFGQGSAPARVTGQVQDAPMTSQRNGWGPTIVYRLNRAETDPVDWAGLPGDATVMSDTAPDSTQGAGTLYTSYSGTQYKRITAEERTFEVGDWLIWGVWVKASSLGSPTAGSVASMADFSVAKISVVDGTESFRFDGGSVNYRYTRSSVVADTRWQWLTGAMKVTTIAPGGLGTLRFELQCDQTHAVSFYGPVLQVIPTGTVTDADINASLNQLYSIPDGVSQGTVAFLKYQKVSIPQLANGVDTLMVTVGPTGLLSSQTIPSGGGGSVSSVFGRTGAVVAVTNDYTWAQIDKSTSSLADITTRSASDLSSGTLPDARFPSTLPATSGVNLTALNASNVSSGLLATARGGTGLDTSASTGVPRISAGTWSADAGISHLQTSSSADLATVLSDEDGTGVFIRGTNPSSITGVTTFSLDAPGSFNLRLVPGSTLNTQNRTLTFTTGDANRTITFNGDLTFGGAVTTGGSFTISGNTTLGSSTHTFAIATTGNTSLTAPTSGTIAVTANKLDAFASTTSDELASILSNETGSGGGFMRATSPTGTNFTVNQAANGDTALTGVRATDTTPTGYFARWRNAANSSDLASVAIDGTVFGQTLTSNLNINVGQHIVGLGATPTLSLGTGAGTGATSDIAGTDMAGWIQVNTGSTPSSSARVFTITFSATYAGQGYILLVPVNANAAALTGGKVVYISDTDRAAGSMQGWVGSTALSASTTYEWYYIVIG